MVWAACWSRSTAADPLPYCHLPAAFKPSAALTSLSGVAQTDVSGTLAGAAVSWSGVIHVTGNVTVPVGTTLTVQPGTLVLIDGNSAPLSTDGKRIIVQGNHQLAGHCRPARHVHGHRSRRSVG